MFRYTICFIQRDEQLLLLNRKKSPEMGKWNGVGGKIESNETAKEGVIRETFEETGILLREVQYAGNVIFKNSEGSDGMYVFIATLPADIQFQTPQETDEGILDWKDNQWVTNVANRGVAENLKFYLPKILNGSHHLEHTFIYTKDNIVDYSFSKMKGDLNQK